jgi:hypothetical protein
MSNTERDAWERGVVVDPSMPAGEIRMVPSLTQEPGESLQAFQARRAAGSVRIVNIGVPPDFTPS